MALLSLLLPLFWQDSVKLTHTYTKGHEVTYTVSVALTRDKVEMSGDVTFRTLDDAGTHRVSAPDITVTERNDKEKASFTIPKLVLDEKGLGGRFTYTERRMPFIVAMVGSYLPNDAIKAGEKFDVSGRYQSFFVLGSGKLMEIGAKNGKQLATIQYEIQLNPNGGEPGVLSVKSVFEVATGELVSSEGKLDIEGATGAVSVKRKA